MRFKFEITEELMGQDKIPDNITTAEKQQCCFLVSVWDEASNLVSTC